MEWSSFFWKIKQREAKWLPAAISDTRGFKKPLRRFGKADGCFARKKTCTCTWACTSASSSCCGQTASYCFLLSSVFCCWHSTPGGRICQPGFSHFVIFSKKEKFITSRFVNWTRFFRISGAHSQKNNGNSPENMVYCLYLWKIEVGSWIENFPAL